MLTPDFAKEEDLERYEAFMAKLVELIVGKYDGSLKAEHGTGINMAPYVEREWGAKATELMWRVKRLADPDDVLSPGVVLNRDPGVHLRDLKTTPAIEESATACVECGFCEPVCPSRDLTTTPRQRIVLRREMARQPAGSPVQRALLEEYEYDALDTCAADGSCQLACPVGIDTGKLVKELRGELHTPRAESLALAAAKRWRTVEGASRAGLRLGGPLARRTKRGRGLPGPARAAAEDRARGRGGRLRPLLHQPHLRAARRLEALVEVSRRAGLPVWIPEDSPGSCCGLPWSSKGFARRAAPQGERDGRAALELERGGGAAGRDRRRLLHPGDRRPGRGCPERGERRAADGDRDPRLCRLGPRPPSSEPRDRGASQLGDGPPDLRHPPHGPRPAPALPRRALAEEVEVAPSATCCGFAGDRGFSHPELTDAATAPQAAELAGRDFDARISSNRTCEIGLARATGAEYESVIRLLERQTRPAAVTS